MRLFFVLLVILVFLAGCAKTPISGNVVIEDVVEEPVKEEATATVGEPQTTEEEVKKEEIEEPKETIIKEEETVKEEKTIEEEKEKVEVIEIKDKQFIPEKLIISKGTKVVWRNNDMQSLNEKKPHMIMVYPVGVRSDKLEFGNEFQYTFTEPKEYWYMDIIYKDVMRKGIIVVE